MTIALLKIGLSIIPTVTLTQLPVIGYYVVPILWQMMWYWNGLALTLPYVSILMQVFIGTIVGTELLLFITHLILGSHDPIR